MSGSRRCERRGGSLGSEGRRRWLPALPVLLVGAAGLAGSAGCVDVTTQAGPGPSGAPGGGAKEAVILPGGEPFPACPEGTVVRGYPAVKGALATYCVTEVEPAVRRGPFVSFYPDGKTLAKGWYEDGNPDGPWVTFHPNGQKRSEGAFARGVRVGTWRFAREDGLPLFQEELSGGARVGGTVNAYDEHGLREVESFVVSGGRRVSHGPALRMKDDGSRLSGAYAMGKAEGSWEERTPKGVAAVRFTMKAGFAEGPFEARWPDSGAPSATGELLKTLPQGAWTLSFRGGEKQAEVRFEKGLLRSIKVFHAGGKERISGEMLDGAPHGAWSVTHPNGTVQVSGVYSKGVRQGTWRTADEQGKTLVEGRYQDGLLVEGRAVEPIVWASPALGETLQGLFADLAWATADRGRTESEQRAIAECMLFGDPAERCLVLDWENFPAQHAGDGPAEIDRRNRLQDLACAMNNPVACARVGRRLAAADPKNGAAAAAGFYLKACDLAPIEAAWRARAPSAAMFKDLRAGAACLWLARMLASGEVKSKALSAAELTKRACDLEIPEACAAAPAPKKKP